MNTTTKIAYVVQVRTLRGWRTEDNNGGAGFTTRRAARVAAEELEWAGFDADQIRIVAR